MEPADNAIPQTPLDPVTEGLFNFAIDREDVTWLVAGLPAEVAADRNTLEYELQLVKIIFVGWSILYSMEEGSLRQELAERYWQAVHELAANVSHTTGLMIGREVDYFAAVRERLAHYLDALQRNNGADPAGVVGREFAYCCGVPDDLFTAMAGSRLFVATLSRIREYLAAVAAENPGAPSN
ncbi:MAG: hypothetical protein AB1413_00615 [Thermodesulfobacteriota bacterium]